MQINKNSLKKEIIGYKKIELNTKELEMVIEQIKNLRVNEIQKAAHISLEKVIKVLEKQSCSGGMSDFEKKLLKEVDRKWFVENLDKIISFLNEEEKKQKKEMSNFKIKYKEKTEEMFKREKPTFKEWIEGVEIRDLISNWNDGMTIKSLKDIISLEVNYDIVKKQIKRW